MNQDGRGTGAVTGARLVIEANAGTWPADSKPEARSGVAHPGQLLRTLPEPRRVGRVGRGIAHTDEHRVAALLGEAPGAEVVAATRARVGRGAQRGPGTVRGGL